MGLVEFGCRCRNKRQEQDIHPGASKQAESNIAVGVDDGCTALPVKTPEYPLEHADYSEGSRLAIHGGRPAEDQARGHRGSHDPAVIDCSCDVLWWD